MTAWHSHTKMDLLEIGSQCSHSSCNQIDFLPVLCHCNKYFCSYHIPSHLHFCPIDPSANTVASHKLQSCGFDACANPSLDAFHANDYNPQITCSQCRKAFCAEYLYSLLANEVYPLNLSVQPSSPEISFMPSYRCSKIAEDCIR